MTFLNKLFLYIWLFNYCLLGNFCQISWFLSVNFWCLQSQKQLYLFPFFLLLLQTIPTLLFYWIVPQTKSSNWRFLIIPAFPSDFQIGETKRTTYTHTDTQKNEWTGEVVAVYFWIVLGLFLKLIWRMKEGMKGMGILEKANTGSLCCHDN